MADPHAKERQTHTARTAPALAAVYASVKADVLSRVGTTGDVINVLRRIWRDSVAVVAGEEIKSTAATIGEKGSTPFDPETVDAYLEAVADNFAERWEATTREMLDKLAAEVDATFAQLDAEVARIMDAVIEAAKTDAADLTDTTVNFTDLEVAQSEGKTTKTWHTTGDDIRSSHAALNGTTVPIDGRFANGLRFPKAPGPPQETVNCKCYLTFGG